LPERKWCGTPKGYKRHKRVGEDACRDCKDALNEYTRLRRSRNPKSYLHGMHSDGVPARVLDKLQIDGGWLTVDILADELGEHHDTVRRALGRLKDKGLTDSRCYLVEARWGPRMEVWEWSAAVLPDHWVDFEEAS
jgi:DNA-binding transcriptional ArsR family regulator